MQAIVRDLASLQIKPASVSWTSDHFATIQDYATRMIADGLAYVDPSPQEEQKEKRLKKEDNAARAHSIAENQRLWKEMLAGSEEVGALAWID